MAIWIMPARPRSHTHGACAALAAMLALHAHAAAGGVCTGDIDGSGAVDGSDLGALLAQWGTHGSAADMDGDGSVGGSDLGALLAAWGPCECAPMQVAPLYPPSTPLEGSVLFATRDALVTHMADRARDRHAREDLVDGVPFRKYDHWLPFYWEQRMAEITIEDHVPMGGSTVVFNFTTHARLNPAEFRTFYGNMPAVAQYHNNMSDLPGAGVTLVSQGPSLHVPGETEYRYAATIHTHWPSMAPLQHGDRIEVELSQFLLAPRNGRDNYYGTAFLYVVGEGVVPWYARAKEEAATPQERELASFDSHPLPTHAWLGGRTTLPYQYSNEPAHRFKQMAGNIAPHSAHAFVRGRRLHHTDFRTGAHSEPDNPPMPEHAGAVGPRFVNTSCVACHVNNGRALPPAVGQPLVQGIVRVGAGAGGAPHPVLGEELQPSANVLPHMQVHIEAEMASALSGVINEPCTDAGGGINLTLLDAGDWMAYAHNPLHLPEAGLYMVDLRVASAAAGGLVQVERAGGGAVYGTVAIPMTGGSQVWQTVRAVLPLPAGTHALGLKVLAGGWNINWLRVAGPTNPGADAEGAAILADWSEVPGAYGDGTMYTLRRPVWAFTGPVPEAFSVRLAPPLVGLGLLEAVSEDTVRALADECDADGDGISGRMAVAEGPGGAPHMGRFGARATQPSLLHQVAYALNRDMGVASSHFPVLDNETAPSAPEISDGDVALLARYVSLLGVGARRGLTDAHALRGEEVFAGIGCVRCHTPVLATGAGHPFGELRGQTIRPYTDLLLHDMGPGLADTLGDGTATAAEWRTAPLWNIGLSPGVSGGESYLHDGRARTLEEAILWHGGEAEAAKERFRMLPAQDRAAVVQFLRSL